MSPPISPPVFVFLNETESRASSAGNPTNRTQSRTSGTEPGAGVPARGVCRAGTLLPPASEEAPNPYRPSHEATLRGPEAKVWGDKSDEADAGEGMTELGFGFITFAVRASAVSVTVTEVGRQRNSEGYES